MKWIAVSLGAFYLLLAAGAESPTPGGEKAPPLDQGLVAYWNFDDGTNTESSKDLVGKNDLTLVGAGRVAGVAGGGIFFDGSSTYAKLEQADQVGPLPAKQGDPLQSFSISVWVRLNSADHRHPILTKEGNLTRGFMLTIERDGQLAAHLYCDKLDTKTTVKSRSKVPNTTWCHLAMTFHAPDSGSGEVKLYINGKLEGTRESLPLPLSTNALPLEIGRVAWSQAYERHMFGRLDELRIYNRVLSKEEVAMLAVKPQDPE